VGAEKAERIEVNPRENDFPQKDFVRRKISPLNKRGENINPNFVY